MAALERRHTSSQTSGLIWPQVARLCLIGAANVGALFFLWKLVLAPGSETQAEQAAQEAPAASLASATPTPPRSEPVLPRAPIAAGLAQPEGSVTASPLLSTNVAPSRGSGGDAGSLEPVLAPFSNTHTNIGDLALEARVKKHIAEAEKRALEMAKDRLRPGEASVSINVHELGVKGDLVSIGADRSVRPASNMKLVTSAAALVLLGLDWTFQTVFDTTAPIANGRVQGDVVVHAAGDPLLDWNADGEVDAFIEKVAAEFTQRGIRAIEGALVLDEGDFQAPAPGPAWPSEKDRWEEYCALAGGFSANAGCITIVVHAAQAGGAAQVEVHPRHHGYAPKIAVQTVGAKEKLDVRVEVRNGALRVEGSIPKDVPQWTARFAVPDPVELFGHALVGGLRARGITVQGGWKRDHVALAGQPVELARLKTPLVDTLVPINTHSNNACADQVFLAMGHSVIGEGTRAGGRAATAKALAKLGLSTEGLVQVDGSGLSRDNRVSARQIAALIDAVLRLDARTSKLFLDSLAVGAETG
jgi:D-alanyl-D-alanine carboxypeptidase/D-alanyl-D-alanine-endopeptidase (penicillin-binding protein 4)